MKERIIEIPNRVSLEVLNEQRKNKKLEKEEDLMIKSLKKNFKQKVREIPEKEMRRELRKLEINALKNFSVSFSSKEIEETKEPINNQKVMKVGKLI